MSSDTMTADEVKALSQSILEKLSSDTPELDKSAADDIDSMTRRDVREGAYSDEFLEPLPIQEGENVVQMDTDQHVIYFPFEPDSPGAYTTDLAATGDDFYLYGIRYPLRLQQVTSGTVTKTLLELETYGHDIRQIVSDNLVKDTVAVKDTTFMTLVDRILGNEDQDAPYAGFRPLHTGLEASFTYEAFQQMQKVLHDEPHWLKPSRFLCSTLTQYDIKAATFNQLNRSTIAEQLFRTGKLEDGEYDGLPYVTTQKKSLVAPGSFYFFPDQKFMGHQRVHTEPTMRIKREGLRIGFSLYMIFGMALGHLACASRTNVRY